MQQPLHPLPRDTAETIALQALAFIASEESRLTRFVQETGISLDELHVSAGEPHVMAAVLELLVRDEPDLLTFAAHQRIEATDVLRAHAAFDPAAYRPHSI